MLGTKLARQSQWPSLCSRFFSKHSVFQTDTNQEKSKSIENEEKSKSIGNEEKSKSVENEEKSNSNENEEKCNSNEKLNEQGVWGDMKRYCLFI